MTEAQTLQSGKGHRDENFPVASALIRPRHRPVILAFYRFARAADDIADHAAAPADDSLSHAVLATLGATSTPLARPFTEHFFRRIDAEDVRAHDVAGWAGMMRGLLEFARVRKPGTPNLRVSNPAQDADGYEPAHTIIDIVTDDMPFLVDSVGIAVGQAGLNVHLVAHPVYSVERDAGGNVLAFAAEGGKGKAESLMHFEIDRVADPAERARLENSVRAALDDVAVCNRDWPAMRDKMLAIADDLGKQKLPLDAAGIAEAQEFLRWAAADHFTFLGYREYRVGQSGGEQVLLAVDGSGLGILHGSERSVAPRSLKSLAARDLPQSGAIDALILTKTNARSSVHRSGYMDYIGVLEFDARGVPVAERPFLGLFTSSAYARRPWEIPAAIRIRARTSATSSKPCRATNCSRPAGTSCSPPPWACLACRGVRARACSCAATNTGAFSRV